LASLLLTWLPMATEIPLEQGPEEGELDLERVKELGGLFLRAPRRRPVLATAVLLGTLALGVLAALFWPRTYGCETRILAKKDAVLPALGNPNRAVRDVDSPTRNAADTILRRDNIEAMIQDLDLVDRWTSTRQPAPRLKDRLSRVFGAPSEQDRHLDMVGLLEQRLVVGADDASITISVEWPDAQTAFDMITFLQENFLEARYDANVNVISEAIRILEERAKPEAAEVDAALAELMKLSGRGVRDKEPTPTAAPAPARDGARSPTPNPGPAAAPRSGDAADELADVRSRLRLLKDDHDRHLMEAQNQLSDARTTLGPLHPTVLGLSAKVAQLAQEPPELRGLRARERELLGEVAGPSPGPQSDATPTTPGRVSPSPASGADPAEPPEVVLARTKLQALSAKYSDLLSRIEAANIELETTRAAFKYQYTIVRPPEMPRDPLRPNVRLVLLVSVLAAALLAFLLPGALDLLRGRLVELWQVERRLKVPILGELMPK
jgi:uncharacterized protein involved in exopolysaccharide biosynthesis